jgi:hypothetical protein
MITALDHIQLPRPEGREKDARDFFGRPLALEEVDRFEGGFVAGMNL